MSYYEFTGSDGLKADCFVHEVLGYRYHWHNTSYELDIVLNGSLEFCHNGQTYLLHPDDVIVVNPRVWHASFCLEPNTRTLVLHLPEQMFRAFLGKDERCEFSFASNAQTRSLPACRRLRFCCAQALLALSDQRVTSAVMARAALEMLAASMYEQLPRQILQKAEGTPRDANGKILLQLLDYVEENYGAKLSLEDLALKFGYNRTYLSSFFKRYIGIGFYDYLTKIRFQHAVWELSATENNLTQVALKSGFPDLKTFNRLFRENFHMMPAEYRKRLTDSIRPPEYNARVLCEMSQPDILAKLQSYVWMAPSNGAP